MQQPRDEHQQQDEATNFSINKPFLIKLILLICVIGYTVYVHERPRNPFAHLETYQYRPEQSMENEGILELTESNWEEYVTFRTHPILLFLYAPSVRCTWSSDFADTFVSLARQIKTDVFPEIRNITVAKLDGFENRFLAFELGIRGFPSIMLLEAPNQSSGNATTTANRANSNEERKVVDTTASTTAVTTAATTTTPNISPASEKVDIDGTTAQSSHEKDTSSIQSQSTDASLSTSDDQSLASEENSDNNRFDGSFIRKTILGELDAFGGLTLNRINRNEYAEYKGPKQVRSIVNWLYKQVLSQKTRRSRIRGAERWRAIVDDNPDKDVLVLIYDSQNTTDEQIDIWNKVRFIDTAKYDLCDIPRDEWQPILAPYNIHINLQSGPQVFLFLAHRQNIERAVEFKLEHGMDELILDKLKQRHLANSHHDEL